MKKLIALLLCLVMVFALASVGSPLALAADKPVKLIAYCPGAGVPFQTVEKFAEIVNAADCGVEVEVHENGTLGNDAEAIESTRMGTIDVICAGTSDLPVAEEALYTARFLGNDAQLVADVGVAGIHRLLARAEDIAQASVVIAVAGMEGALASVVGGMASAPVIAVPTSVGYGASFGGLAALLSMMDSCASGVSVVNIDNGFGAAYQAHLINHMGR